MIKLRITFIVFALIGLFFASSTAVSASHSWGSYHWARTSNPFTLKMGDNLSPNWDAYLATTSSDWNNSSVLDTLIVPGSTNPKNCRTTSGKIEVCNSKYGNNGWLGIAQIWASGNHITQGVTKLNDSYFNTSKYNRPEWKNLVMCQEVGHVFGLDHQDEVFNNINLGSCMDYTDDPSGALRNQSNNEHPNQHDYDHLTSMYTHLDTFTSIQSGMQKLPLGDFSSSKDWGKQVKSNGRVALFERDFGNGHKLFTFTIWALE